MIPVDQTLFGDKRPECPEGGNCFAACVASLFELPLADVPHFCSGESWWQRYTDWCVARDVFPVFLRVGHELSHGRAPAGYTLVGGPSPRNPKVLHACVALDGVIVHDPHADDRRGVLEIVDYITHVPITEART